jgi:hypothetical protein
LFYPCSLKSIPQAIPTSLSTIYYSCFLDVQR